MKNTSSFAHYCVLCVKLVDPVSETLFSIKKVYNSNKREKQIFFCNDCFLDYAGTDVERKIESKGLAQNVATSPVDWIQNKGIK